MVGQSGDGLEASQGRPEAKLWSRLAAICRLHLAQCTLETRYLRQRMLQIANFVVRKQIPAGGTGYGRLGFGPRDRCSRRFRP
jgi:hypothetical protein